MQAGTYSQKEVEDALSEARKYLALYYPDHGQGDLQKLAFTMIEFARWYGVYHPEYADAMKAAATAALRK